jgi:hypothetical protein
MMLQVLISNLEPSLAPVCVSKGAPTPPPLEDSVQTLKCANGGLNPISIRTNQQQPGASLQNVIEENTGKNLISIYITHNILNCHGEIPAVSFNRLAYQMYSIQDAIKRRFAKVNSEMDDDNRLPSNQALFEILMAKEDELVRLLKASQQSDIIVALDTFLNFIVSMDENSALYSFASHLVNLIGKLLFVITPPQSTLTPFQRLVGTREIQNLIQLHFTDSLKNHDVARIIHSFSDHNGDTSESERVSHLLSIKAYMNSINDSVAVKNHSGFLSLLASLITFEKSSSRYQLSTLYFSESLTVLNSNKRYWSFKGAMSQTYAKTRTEVIFKDCTFALHILAHLSYFGFENVLTIVQDDRNQSPDYVKEESILKKIILAKRNSKIFTEKYDGDFECLLLACMRYFHISYHY